MIENANKKNQEGFDFPNSLKQKAPGLPKETLKKAKIHGQNHHSKQFLSPKAASESLNY